MPVQVDEAVSETGRRSGPPMTVDGAVQKTSLLLAVAAAAGAATWMQVRAQQAAHRPLYSEIHSYMITGRGHTPSRPHPSPLPYVAPCP